MESSNIRALLCDTSADYSNYPSCELTRLKRVFHNSLLIRRTQQKNTKNSETWPGIQPRSLA